MLLLPLVLFYFVVLIMDSCQGGTMCARDKGYRSGTCIGGGLLCFASVLFDLICIDYFVHEMYGRCSGVEVRDYCVAPGLPRQTASVLRLPCFDTNTCLFWVRAVVLFLVAKGAVPRKSGNQQPIAVPRSLGISL